MASGHFSDCAHSKPSAQHIKLGTWNHKNLAVHGNEIVFSMLRSIMGNNQLYIGIVFSNKIYYIVEHFFSYLKS